MSTELDPAFLPGLPEGFRRGMEFIWRAEQDGHQNDSAPGEKFRTSWGVTQATWDGAVHEGIVSGKLENATKAQAGNIYLAKYWNALRLSDLPAAVGFVLFVDATLMGPGRAAKSLQHIVGVPEDGIIGPKTIAATNDYIAEHGQDALIDALIDASIAYLGALPNAPTFIRGWTRRENEERTIAHEIAATEVAPQPAAPVVPEVPTIPTITLPPIPVAGVEGKWIVTIERAAS